MYTFEKYRESLSQTRSLYLDVMREMRTALILHSRESSEYITAQDIAIAAGASTEDEINILARMWLSKYNPNAFSLMRSEGIQAKRIRNQVQYARLDKKGQATQRIITRTYYCTGFHGGI